MADELAAVVDGDQGRFPSFMAARLADRVPMNTARSKYRNQAYHVALPRPSAIRELWSAHFATANPAN
jgi:hypothetical protein